MQFARILFLGICGLLPCRRDFDVHGCLIPLISILFHIRFLKKIGMSTVWSAIAERGRAGQEESAGALPAVEDCV